VSLFQIAHLKTSFLAFLVLTVRKAKTLVRYTFHSSKKVVGGREVADTSNSLRRYLTTSVVSPWSSNKTPSPNCNVFLQKLKMRSSDLLTCYSIHLRNSAFKKCVLKNIIWKSIDVLLAWNWLRDLSWSNDIGAKSYVSDHAHFVLSELKMSFMCHNYLCRTCYLK